MSTRIPTRGGGERLVTLAVLMREAFVALNDLVMARLAERGHSAVRSAHSAALPIPGRRRYHGQPARRARPGDQAGHGRTHAPPRGARLRHPGAGPEGPAGQARPATDRGHEVLAIARQLVPEIDDPVSGIVDADRLRALKADLEAIRRNVAQPTRP